VPEIVAIFDSCPQPISKRGISPVRRKRRNMELCFVKLSRRVSFPQCD
jgi:hypothetical protein